MWRRWPLFSACISSKLQKAVDTCSQIDVKNEDSWNRCFAHANAWEEISSRQHEPDPIWRKSYVEKKTQDLQQTVRHSLSSRGSNFAQACASFSDAGSCRGFAEEIIQKLVDFDLSREALKLLFFTKGAIGSLIASLAMQNKWRQGVDVILTYAKQYPPAEIQDQIASFSNQLMASKEAYRGFELLALNDQLEIEKTIEAAFGHEGDDHLHRGLSSCQIVDCPNTTNGTKNR